MENSQNKGEIVIYQPDEVTRLEVRVEGETVWLTQEQIALLFGVKRPAITKHIRNIFAIQELEEMAVCSILERTASVETCTGRIGRNPHRPHAGAAAAGCSEAHRSLAEGPRQEVVRLFQDGVFSI